MTKKKHEHVEVNPYSVGSAIAMARMRYGEHRSASHPLIEALEDWINSNVRASREDKQLNVERGHLRRSPTSGRYFIQLLVH